jgi:hypothetical protein
VARRIIVADRDDRPRHCLDLVGADMSGHGPILAYFDPLFEADHRRVCRLVGSAWFDCQQTSER